MHSKPFYQSKTRKFAPSSRAWERSRLPRVIQLLEPADAEDVLVEALLRIGVTPKVVAVLAPNRVFPLSRNADVKKPAVCLGSELWQTL